MVTKKELSDFKESLTSGLQQAGYTAYGRISSSEDTYNTYAHLPALEMVARYVDDNNLDEINRVYRILKYISDNEGKRFSLKTLCNEQGIDYRIVSHAIENTPYIDKTGTRRSTRYSWIHEELPSFQTAKAVFEHILKLKSNELNKEMKAKIRKAVAKGISKDDFFKNNKIKKEATYNAELFFYFEKYRQQKGTNGSATETVPEYTPEDETPSISPEQEYQEPVSTIEEPTIEEPTIEEPTTEEPVQEIESIETQPDMPDEAGLQMENYILRQEIRYLKKINKAKDKLIKALRRKG